MTLSRARLAALPKAELHVHLDGSLRPSTMLELAGEEGVALAARSAEALADYMVVRGAHDLEEYLQRYHVTLTLMQRREALERIAEEFVRDVAAEGVTYVETRWCPELHTRGGLARDEAVEAVVTGLRKGEDATGVVARTIICSLRTFDPGVSLELAAVASDFAGDGVVAFDLAGAERGHPPGHHRAAFERARAGGLHVTVHAGEAAGAESIREALELCHAERLGHGTRLFEDPALQARITERGVALEVCITSNVQTRAVRAAEAHPVTQYLRAGVPVTLNTDSRLMGGITLIDEYALAVERLGWTAAEARTVALNGFRAAFLTDGERAELLARAERDWAEVA